MLLVPDLGKIAGDLELPTLVERDPAEQVDV
jgi:hypothetical protein